MGKSRRSRRSSNRRLPNFPSNSSPIQIAPTISQLRLALGLTRRADYEDAFRPLRRTKSHLAQNPSRPQARSTFPRTFKGPTPSLTPTEAHNTALKADVCVSRGIRSEVLHATGKAGKRGQKRPVWTPKSKVRC